MIVSRSASKSLGKTHYAKAITKGTKGGGTIMLAGSRQAQMTKAIMKHCPIHPSKSFDCLCHPNSITHADELVHERRAQGLVGQEVVGKRSCGSAGREHHALVRASLGQSRLCQMEERLPLCMNDETRKEGAKDLGDDVPVIERLGFRLLIITRRRATGHT